jgi:hypothetical protein
MSNMLMQETAVLETDDHIGLRPDLDGLLISSPGTPGTVWLIMNGGYRALVPGGATGQTFKNLFVPKAAIISDINATDITEGEPITEGAILAVDPGGTVFLISNRLKWPITSGGFSRYQFNSATVVTPSPILLEFIPYGPQINWPQ